MFELELTGPWTLDLRRMLRPHRSGVLANLAIYGLLFGAGGGYSAASQYEREHYRPVPEKRYNVTRLHYGKGGKKQSGDCVCKVYMGEAYFFEPLAEKMKCGEHPMIANTEYPFESGGWIVWAGVGTVDSICIRCVKESESK